MQRLQQLKALQDELNAIEAQRLSQVDVFGTLGYEPTPRQQEFHDATEFDTLFGGAAGGGKTKALVMHAIRECVRYPGIRVGAFRRTYGELKESLLAELALAGYARALGAVWKGTDYELRFPNGSLIMFRYAETMADATRRLGGQYQLLLFDERTLTNPDVVSFLESRMRSGRTDIPVLGIRSATNPGGPGHTAVKDRYIKPTNYGEKVIIDQRGREVRFIPSRLSDNPHVNPEYASDLLALPEKLRAAYLDGDWDVFAGQMFPEWSRDRHVVPPRELPGSWRRYAGVDWGYTAPWAVVWAALDEDGRVWVYREMYAKEVGEADQARRILTAENNEHVTARYADDAMWATRGDALPIAQVYLDNGCALTPAGKGPGSRITGWQRIHSYLAEAPACPEHRERGWETCPRLHAFSNLERFATGIADLPHSPTGNPEDADTRADDHCLVAGTQVVTARGLVAIEQVTTNDLVATRAGWRPVVFAGRTGVDRPVLTVTSSDGRTLKGTANHPVYTVNRGFVPLDALRYADILVAWPEDVNPGATPALLSQSCSTGSPSAGTRSHADSPTRATSPLVPRTGPGVLDGFTRRSTRLTTGRSRQGTTSITRTMTTTTTSQTTSSCCQSPTITATTFEAASQIWVCSNGSDPWLQHGTDQTKAASGIGSTDREPGKAGARSTTPARCAARSTSLVASEEAASVPTTAGRSGGDCPEWTTRTELARSAAACSGSTSMPGYEPVHASVVSVCDEGETADVYNLTVAGQPEYFANGLLVHNCADATRYLLVNIGNEARWHFPSFGPAQQTGPRTIDPQATDPNPAPPKPLPAEFGGFPVLGASDNPWEAGNPWAG